MNERIKGIFNDLIKKKATVGINYAVIMDKNIYTGSLGLRTKYTSVNNVLKLNKEKNSLNTIYDIASLTKVLCTLTIIFRLYEKDLIKLDDKVNKYIDDFIFEELTIYDLITHTSCLYLDTKIRNIMSKEDVLDLMHKSIKRDKRRRFIYSDINYILLGVIIEKICNKSLDLVFKEEVTDILDMKNTMFNPKKINLVAPTEFTKKRGVVRGIVHDEKACSMNGVAGHAGVFSNIHDLINYTCMILNDGIYNGKRYLDKKTIDMWFKPLLNIKGYNRSFCFYVGNNPNIINKNNVISFSGFTGPSISIDRENNIIIIMLSNRVHPSRKNNIIKKLRIDISDKIYELLLKGVN